ncbi:sugar phosphate isomerase/epimerase family protein [Novisyntrophococcus fermenticellae]|uniref:sugar phosphate isomerase/epimerase family protein n=1 Tax=Novisyntrophococcus fermenticellae TaxID=2068655 RepID=UPI001E61EF15|nr:sugar phosphate isomerase/epimerase family protein [Novisyntrophococcus fermenticellae]
MRLATMTNLFRDQRGLDTHIGYIESMRRCKAAGFDTLDLNMCAMFPGKTEFNREDWRAQADKIREEAEKLGIVFSQSHPPYRPSKFPHFKTKEEEDYFDEITRRSIIISGMLGVKWAVMHPVTACENAEYSLEEDIASNHEVFASVIELAAKENVGIAFENMADRDNKRRFGATVSELKSLVDSFGDAKMGVCWDIGHGNRMYMDSVRPIKEMGEYIKALHVDDNHGGNDEHLVPFLGSINWEGVMKALKEIGYEGDFVYEIKLNDYMPDALKDSAAKFAAEIGRYLVSMC